MTASDENPSGTLVDPVSGRTFAAGSMPISSIYRGRAYYFETRGNRDAFEGNPEKYLAGPSAAGQPIAAENTYGERPRRRRGC